MSVPVSVVIPCYRCAATIGRAVASVLAQTAPPREIILVDDCSGDGTLEALQEIAAGLAGGNSFALEGLDTSLGSSLGRVRMNSHLPAPMVRVMAQEQNGGPAAARNAGWEAATQPLVAFLDADDAWHREKLEIQAGWMLAHPDAALTGHSTFLAGEEGADCALATRAFDPQPVSPARLLASNRFPTRTVMLKRDLPYRFDPRKRRSEDYLLWLVIVLNNHRGYRSDLPLACSFKADFGAGGLSADLWQMERGELETFAQLRRDKLISPLAMAGAMAVSLAKYCRRALLASPAR